MNDNTDSLLTHIEAALTQRRFSHWSMHYLLPGEIASVQINTETMLFGFIEHRIKLAQVSEKAAEEWDHVIWRSIDKLKRC